MRYVSRGEFRTKHHRKEKFMRSRLLSTVGRGLPTLTIALLCGILIHSMPVMAWDDDRDSETAMIRRGFEIAPVPLDFRGKDRALVGLGSYLVNAVAGCNGCHSAGPTTEYTLGGNPYFKGNPPTVVNQATYLGGGRNFGALIPGTPEIVSRNLTPDRTGRPVGGRTFEEFLHIIRTGDDLDHLHPNCSASITSNCFPVRQPFNGDLLQIMPWPDFQHLTRHEVRAIYEYLRAIPCNPGPAAGVLHNDCI
jgi:hypothetical protein